MERNLKKLCLTLKFSNNILPSLSLIYLFFILLFCCNNRELSNETLKGESKYFDSILYENNRNWLFYFFNDSTLIEVDFLTKEERTILNIRESQGSDSNMNNKIQFVYMNGSNFVLKIDQMNFSKGEFLNSKYYLFNKTINMLSSLSKENYNFSWMPPYWINENSFILLNKKTKLIEGINNEAVFLDILKFTIQDSILCDIIPVDLPSPSCQWQDSLKMLFLISDYSASSQDNVKVFDSAGLRDITSKEFQIYNSNKTTKSESINNSMVGLVQPEYTLNNNTEIYLNNRIVRITKSNCTQPTWLSDFNLFLWQEDDFTANLKTFIMDIYGHYSFWHSGTYCGRIKKENVN